MPNTPAAQRTIVITGASDGIGAVAARELATDGSTLILVGRSATKLAAVAEQTGGHPLQADFAELDSVRRLAEQIAERTERIDVLLNNAGGTFAPAQRTADGHEPNFQINHLAPFLLTHLVRDRLRAAGASLVVNTASVGNLAGKVTLDDLDGHTAELRAYGTSKLENILFTRGIAQRWSADGIVSAAVHPGAVASSFGRDSALVGLLYRTPLRHVAAITPERGAAPLVRLARGGADPSVNGVYFHRNRRNGPVNPQAKRVEVVDGLWTRSAELVGVAVD